MQKQILLIGFCLLNLFGCSYIDNKPLKVLSHENDRIQENIKLPNGFAVRPNPQYALNYKHTDDSQNITSIILPPIEK